MECKRIPSARINCASLRQILKNPCTSANTIDLVGNIEGMTPTDWARIMKTAKETFLPEQFLAWKKWLSQRCNPKMNWIKFWTVGIWGNKSTYYFGEGQYKAITYIAETIEKARATGLPTVGRTVIVEPARDICLYFGKSRIQSYMVRGWGRGKDLAVPGTTPLKHIWPKFELWDDPEYYMTWQNIKRKKEPTFLEEDGGIRYWTATEVKIISPEKQEQFKTMDLAVKITNEAYKFCLETQTVETGG